MNLTRYLVSRILQMFPLLILVTLLSYAVIRLAPGDPTNLFISPKVRPEDRERIRQNLGLGRPIPVQYGIWLKNLVTRGELGYSVINGRAVSECILERLPYTLVLMGAAYALTLLVAIPLGILSAVRKGGCFDFLSTIGASFGISIPSFWLGLLAIYFLTLKFRVLPSCGMGSGVSGSFVALILDMGHHLIAPVFVLVIANFGYWARYARGSMLEVLGEDYVKVAWAKGLSPARVWGYHAFRNAMLPLVSLLGLSLPDLFSGAFITEYIFALPGMGRFGIEAISHRDYPVLMGIILFSTLLVLVGNLLADICYVWVDPRIRIEK